MPTIVLADSSNFLIPNGTFVVELVIFLLILAVIGRFVVPPIQGAISRRREVIRSQFADAEEAKKRAAEAEGAYQEALTQARAEATRIREDARAKGRQVIEDFKATAQEQADRITAEGRMQLAASRAALLPELRAEIGTLGVELASRIVGESLADETRRSGIVEQFMDELDQRSAEAPARVGTP